jgi:UDP-N-acetylmuramyl pentapeptide phosphotransferase/UDP-N-acetylglucosamine-1-phosphate transferase
MFKFLDGKKTAIGIGILILISISKLAGVDVPINIADGDIDVKDIPALIGWLVALTGIIDKLVKARTKPIEKDLEAKSVALKAINEVLREGDGK